METSGIMVDVPVANVLCLLWSHALSVCQKDNQCCEMIVRLNLLTVGAVGVLWLIPYLLFVFDSPSTHPRISVTERFYIASNLQLKEDQVTMHFTCGSSKMLFFKTVCPPQVPTPWFHIFTSSAVWAIIVANFCYCWGLYTLLTCMPTYFKEVLGLSYQNVSFDSFAPLSLFCFVVYLSPLLFLFLIVFGRSLFLSFCHCLFLFVSLHVYLTSCPIVGLPVRLSVCLFGFHSLAFSLIIPSITAVFHFIFV